MSSSIVFHFEDNIASIQSGRDIDMEVWKSIVYAFNIDKYICVDCTSCGIRYEDVNKSFEKINCLNTFVQNNLNINYVFLIPHNHSIEGIESIDLKNLDHPVDNVCYVFGRDSCGLHNNKDILNRGICVSINCGPNSLFSHIAAGIVLYDRSIKV